MTKQYVFELCEYKETREVIIIECEPEQIKFYKQCLLKKYSRYYDVEVYVWALDEWVDMTMLNEDQLKRLAKHGEQ